MGESSRFSELSKMLGLSIWHAAEMPTKLDFCNSNKNVFCFFLPLPYRYGDRFPITIAGRLLSVAWVLVGLVITGIMIGSFSAVFSILTVVQDVPLYGTDVSTLRYHS